MKRSLCLLILFVMVSVQAVTRHALVIGIGDYPASSGWAKINGDKDIPLVEEMLTTNGFAKQNIVELKNERATCAAIKSEFEKLISKAAIGDYVYIHFSGHGQQMTDLNGDEEEELDEAWIPYDAQYAFSEGKYEGQNHLVDDQLNHYFHRIRERVGKEGKIVIVADACHSGSGSRGETDEEYIVRGTSDVFVIPISKNVAVIPSYTIEWTFISACEPHQCNYECQGNGSLTYALYQQRANFSKLSTKQIWQKIKKCISECVTLFIQVPVLEVTVGAENDIFL
ncbi:MAG: caspase family protein [Paludibacteraceae bacterium]